LTTSGVGVGSGTFWQIREARKMELSERIALIIKENNLKQKELAAIIGVTESYISALLRKRNINPSQSFANLIEEKLGYNARWVLTGEGQKIKAVSKHASLSDVHKKAIIQLEKMPMEQIKAVLAFINSLEEVERRINHIVPPDENNPVP
jgi:transcriptional regulator with XRE-family HTH domain